MQFRVYDTDRSPNSVKEATESVLREVKEQYDPKATIAHQTQEGWHQSKVSYRRRYGDYGATAIVDYRYRRANNRLFVFVFMYTDRRPKDDPTIRTILQSFRTTTAHK